MKKIFMLMTVSSIALGASSAGHWDGHIVDGEPEIVTVRVKHIDTTGIRDTYIFRHIEGSQDLAKRVENFIKVRPELGLPEKEWTLSYHKAENSTDIVVNLICQAAKK